ncbi:MAG TPA: cyclic nucleotide-binding domain-containing protein [Acidimicrobiales bacterium]
MLGPRRRRPASLLAGLAPFDRYTRRQLRELAAHADRLRVPEGTVIAREGGLVRELVVVVGGVVRASRRGAGERRLGAGTRLGARELVTGAPHPATLVAGPGLEVVVVNGPAYRGAVQALGGPAEPGWPDERDERDGPTERVGPDEAGPNTPDIPATPGPERLSA